MGRNVNPKHAIPKRIAETKKNDVRRREAHEPIRLARDRKCAQDDVVEHAVHDERNEDRKSVV